MIPFLTQFLKNLFKEPVRDTVLIDDSGVLRQFSDGRSEQVGWDELSKVTILTNDLGPYLEDVFFVLEAADKGVLVSHEWAVKVDLLDHLSKRLENFDHNAVIAAMSCTQNDSFLCWQKS